MIKLDLRDTEIKLMTNLKRNFSTVGFDIAGDTGVCYAKTDTKFLYLDWTLLSWETQGQGKLFTTIYKDFGTLIDKEDLVIIEDTHVRFNPAVALLLTRMGAFCMAQCINKNIPFELIGPVSARSKVGINQRKIPKGKSKEYIKEWLQITLGVKMEENNVADAIILALCGLIEGCQFKKMKTKKKKKPLDKKM